MECRYNIVIALASFFSYALNGAILYTVAPLFVAWVEEFEAGSGVTAVIGSFLGGLQCVAAPLSSYLNDRYGFRPLVITGGLIISLGVFATAFANSIYVVLITYAVIVPIGIGLLAVPYSTIVTYYFDKGRAFAVAFTTAGGGFGQFIMSFIAQASMEAYGWRGSLFISTGLCLQYLVIGSLMRDPKNWNEMKRKRKEKPGKKCSKGIGFYRKWTVVLFFMHSFLFYFGQSIVVVHVTAFAEIRGGVSKKEASFLLSMLGVSQVIGRIGSGAIGQMKCVDTFLFYAITCFLSGLSTLIVPIFSVYPAFLTWSVAFGLFLSPTCSLYQIILLTFMDLSDINAGFAHLMIWQSVGYIAGAPTAGALYDVTRDYRWSFFLGGGVYILSSLCLIFPYISVKRQGMKALDTKDFGSIVFSSFVGSQEHDHKQLTDKLESGPMLVTSDTETGLPTEEVENMK